MTASTRRPVSRSRLVALGVAASTAGVLAAAGPADAAAVGSGAAVAAASSAGVVGTVLSVDASARTFVIRVASGAHLRVDVTTTTVYKVGGGASATFAALRPGESVAVIGTGSSRSETAAIVVIGKASSGSAGSGSPGAFGGGFPGGFGRGTFGTVVSVDASGHSFELKSAKGAEVKVVVTSSTTYRDRTDSSASFAQVKKGESVAVLGTTSKGVETAKTVVIGLPRGIGGAVPQPSGS